MCVFFNLEYKETWCFLHLDDIFMKLSRWWRLLISGICSFQDLLVSGITCFRSYSFKDFLVSGSGLRIKVVLVYMVSRVILMCEFCVF